MNKDKIVVSLTTWKKRDEFAVKMLEHFQDQTIKPDEIILWLSESEYGNNIPQHLQECLDKKWITDIRFVPGNTKCYKRWEVFKEYYNDYVIIIDDDFFFPNDLVEVLYKTAKEQNLPCCYFEKTFDYIGVERQEIAYEQCSLKNQLYPGFCCIPPGTLSKDCNLFSDKFLQFRSKYCPVSDDLWISLYLKKNNIPVYGVKHWDTNEIKKWVIDDSQSVGLWDTENKIKKDGVSTVVRNFATLIDATNSKDFIKKLFPKFDISKCSDKSLIDKNYEDSVSIIMTAYKTKKYIKQAIDSVYNQTYFRENKYWELLIGIDGCEETLEYLKTIMPYYDSHLRVFMMDSNKGTYITSNTLLKIAKYNWILRFDSDDVLMSDSVKCLVDNSLGYDCCIYKYGYMKEDGTIMSNKISNRICRGSIFVKKSVIDRLGGYEPWPVSADADLLHTRIERFFKVNTIDRPMLYYRNNPDSLTRNKNTCGGTEIRTKYNNIWENKYLTDIKDAIIECITNNYYEIYVDEYKYLNGVIYTVSDNPEEITNKKADYDYVCFTNQDIQSDTWKIRSIPDDLKKFSKEKQKSIIKICPHLYLPEYDFSIYTETPNEIKHISLVDGKSVYMYKYSDRGCIYREANSCINSNLDKWSTIHNQMMRYSRNLYPVKNGLAKTDTIYRLHNSNYCKKLMNRWRTEVEEGSYIDRLSFNYCLWKVGNKGFAYV